MRSINSHRIAVLNQKIGIILDWPKFIGLNKTYLTWLKKQKSFLKSLFQNFLDLGGPKQMAKIYFEPRK